MNRRISPRFLFLFISLSLIYFLRRGRAPSSNDASPPPEKRLSTSDPFSDSVADLVGNQIKAMASSADGLTLSSFTSTPQGRRKCFPLPPKKDKVLVLVVAGNKRLDAPLNNLLVSLRVANYQQVHVLGRGRGVEDQDWRAEAKDLLKSVARGSVAVLILSRNVLFLEEPDDLQARWRASTAEVLVPGCANDASCKSLPPAILFGNPSKLSSLLDTLGTDEAKTLWSIINADKDVEVLPDSAQGFRLVSPVKLRGGDDLLSSKSTAAIHFAGMTDPNEAALITLKLNDIQGLYQYVVQSLSSRWTSPKRPRIVVSLTSIPPRLPNLWQTLDTIANQTLLPDMIYLNLPTSSSRFSADTYDIPASLADTLPVPIKINRCKDFGPATKLLGVLPHEKDPDTLIITIDDDMGYPSDTILDLLTRFQKGGQLAAVAYAGQMVDNDHGKLKVRTAASMYMSTASVDILEAFRGVLYKRGWFDASIEEIPEECRSTDDIWISAHLASKGVPRIKLSRPAERGAWFTANDKVETLRDGNVFGEKKNNKCAALVLDKLKQGWLEETVQCPFEYRNFFD